MWRLLSKRGWRDVDGKWPKVGSVAQFRFGDRGGSDMEILELEGNQLVHWMCRAHLSGGEWLGTDVFFDLSTGKRCHGGPLQSPAPVGGDGFSPLLQHEMGGLRA
jgi:hypothetical protein